MDYPGVQRGRLQNKYHYCGRCSRRVPLGEMQWQNGILVCKQNDCIDTELPENRDARINRAVEVAGQSNELQPDPKLTVASTIDPDEVTFVP